MADEKNEAPKPAPQPQNSDRPKFPENRPINGDNRGLPVINARD